MRVELTEESHNHVDWETRWPLVKTEIGLLAGLLLLLLVVIPSPSPARWTVVGVATGLVVLVGTLLAATSPPVDRGHLERLPEGGDLKRAKVWPVIGERAVVDVGLDHIAGFEVEERRFEDAQPTTYSLARLWAVGVDGERIALTTWAQLDSVALLERALERALRLENA